MKRVLQITSLVVLSSIVVGVVYAELKTGYYSPAELGMLRQPAATALAAGSNYRVSAYPVPVVDLAAGDGALEVRSYCNTCHSPRYILMQPPLPAAAWGAEVNKMDKTFGAAIPLESKQKIIRYLQTHYTPETRKK